MILIFVDIVYILIIYYMYAHASANVCSTYGMYDIIYYIYMYGTTLKNVPDATPATSYAVQVRGIYGLGGFLKMSKELLVLKLGSDVV